MKTIALIDTRSEVPGKTLGILVSTHPDMVAAFAGNDAFQKTEAAGGHIRTKIVTLKDHLEVGQVVQPAHLAQSQMNQSKIQITAPTKAPLGTSVRWRCLPFSHPDDGWPDISSVIVLICGIGGIGYFMFEMTDK